MKLLLATRNQGKVREAARLLAHLPLELVSLDQEGIEEEAEETGDTFEENTAQKSLFYSSRSGLITVAEDSGLEVDALGGRPGVRSARYGGPGLDDAGRVQLVLREMEGVEPSRRGARFVSCVALSRHGSLLETFRGTCEGVLLTETRGSGGFGYDPIFYRPDLGKTTAEISLARKNLISHRGQAFRLLAAGLLTFFPGLSSGPAAPAE
jgi:XTP/dITP diphosphohydrolase